MSKYILVYVFTWYSLSLHGYCALVNLVIKPNIHDLIQGTPQITVSTHISTTQCVYNTVGVFVTLVELSIVYVKTLHEMFNVSLIDETCWLSKNFSTKFVVIVNLIKRQTTLAPFYINHLPSLIINICIISSTAAIASRCIKYTSYWKR